MSKGKEAKKESETSRAIDFSEVERRSILAFVKDHKELLLSTKNDHNTIEGKKELWSELAQKLSALGTARSTNEVKLKWTNLYRFAKLDNASMKRPPTGGGRRPKTRWESRVIIEEIGVDDPGDIKVIPGGIDTGNSEEASKLEPIDSSADSSAEDEHAVEMKGPPEKKQKV